MKSIKERIYEFLRANGLSIDHADQVTHHMENAIHSFASMQGKFIGVSEYDYDKLIEVLEYLKAWDQHTDEEDSR